MATCVYCLARSEAQAIRIAQRLRNSGFPSDDISLLYPDPSSPRDLAHENSTKAPEGATIGAGTGAIVGGALGWLTGIGVIAISGMAPLVAAGRSWQHSQERRQAVRSADSPEHSSAQ